MECFIVLLLLTSGFHHICHSSTYLVEYSCMQAKQAP